MQSQQSFILGKLVIGLKIMVTGLGLEIYNYIFPIRFYNT